MRRSAVALLVAVTACAGPLDRDERMDPQTCGACHPRAYQEWSGSMHAYASVDPVFRAMNARGQRETNGQLGELCVRCHAPLALAEGATRDGTNLDTVDAKLQGIGCAFCHQLDAVTGTHDAAVRWADDGVMRGGIADPYETDAHASAYSTLHDRDALASSSMCGACHDVVLPNGHALERTYVEWQRTLYSSESSAERLSCQGCHMAGSDGRAAEVEGAPIRRVKSHMFPAVDTAVVPFPERDAQRAAVERELATTFQAQLCVIPFADSSSITVYLDNVAAGHSFPSGVAHDRRLWLELVAERGGAPLFSTGVVADDRPITTLDDPHLFLLRDRALTASGEDALMFWEVARSEPHLMPGPATRDPTDPRFNVTHRKLSFRVPSRPDVVRMRMRLQPIAREVLDSLVASGDLDPALVPRFPVFDLGSTVIDWRGDEGQLCVSR